MSSSSSSGAGITGAIARDWTKDRTVPPGASTALFIDLDAIAENYRILREVSGTDVAASIKADAYGLGADRVAPVLAAAGCRTFFVATGLEGAALRAILPDAEICVLNGFMSGERELFTDHRLSPVLNSLDQIRAWLAEAGSGDQPVLLHVDTGMNRLGLETAEVDALVAGGAGIADSDVSDSNRPDLRALNIGCIMSHLACSDEPEHPANRTQFEAFKIAFARLSTAATLDNDNKKPPRASLANSGGIFLGPDYQFDMARAGAALYGLHPAAGARESSANPMRQVVHLYAKILQIRDVDTPMTVGYGATHKVSGKRRIATVSAGYADGYLRIISQTDPAVPAPDQWGLHRAGTAYLGDVPVPLVGRISMDLISIDVTDVPNDQAAQLCAVGAPVELIGPHLSVDEVAETGGTIGYEILTRFGSRCARAYLSGGRVADIDTIGNDTNGNDAIGTDTIEIGRA
jgi:alanine racemase